MPSSFLLSSPEQRSSLSLVHFAYFFEPSVLRRSTYNRYQGYFDGIRSLGCHTQHERAPEMGSPLTTQRSHLPRGTAWAFTCFHWPQRWHRQLFRHSFSQIKSLPDSEPLARAAERDETQRYANRIKTPHTHGCRYQVPSARPQLHPRSL